MLIFTLVLVPIHAGANSNAGASSTVELVPVPTLLVTSKTRFRFQKILEPPHT